MREIIKEHLGKILLIIIAILVILNVYQAVQQPYREKPPVMYHHKSSLLNFPVPVVETEDVYNINFLLTYDITSHIDWLILRNTKANHIGDVIADSGTGLIPGDYLIIEIPSPSDPLKWITIEGQHQVKDRWADEDNSISLLVGNSALRDAMWGNCRVKRITGITWRVRFGVR